MKIRKGFVSNSSSSSFICDITGNVESGMDVPMSEFNMCGCVNGHTFLFEGYPKVEAWLISEEEMDGDQYYEVPEDICPVCNGDAKPQIIKRIKAELAQFKITAEELK